MEQKKTEILNSLLKELGSFPVALTAPALFTMQAELKTSNSQPLQYEHHTYRNVKSTKLLNSHLHIAQITK
jgi:hypothetical protein